MPQKDAPFAATVLIAGPSGSGKTSLAALVAKGLGRTLLSLDDFWLGGAPHYVNSAAHGKVRTFEEPSLYDGQRLASALISRVDPTVVEGFCLFFYPQIQAIPGRRFYLDLPFEVCLSRRMARIPHRPSDRSFLKIGESEMKRVVLPQRSLPGVKVLDGTMALEALAASIIKECQS